MPLRFLKLALRAKDVPEVSIVLRVVVGLMGLFVLLPVVRAALDPSGLGPTDLAGLVVFTAVGLWLLRAAAVGDRAGKD